MNMFLIIGRDGGLELAFDESTEMPVECPCPRCTAKREASKQGKLDHSDVDVDTYRAPDNGGWSQATSGVRLVHKPTGIQSRCDTERSAHANKAKAWAALEQAVAQYYGRREELKSYVTPQRDEGPAVNLEFDKDVELAPDQFAYVDSEAGTAYFENINDPVSRVRAELMKRGWTPPGGIEYPPVKRAQPGEGSGDASRREGWNECRIAAMHLNRKS